MLSRLFVSVLGGALVVSGAAVPAVGADENGSDGVPLVPPAVSVDEGLGGQAVMSGTPVVEQPAATAPVEQSPVVVPPVESTPAVTAPVQKAPAVIAQSAFSSLKKSVKFKAGKKAVLKVSISPAAKRSVVLERKVSGKWKKVSAFTSSAAGNVKITFPKSVINKELTSTWRIVSPAVTGSSPASKVVSRVITVKTTPKYQTPGKYQKVVTKIPAAKGSGYSLTRGMNGVKVAKVQRKLGMGSRWETMDAATMSRVRNFQVKKGLKATGVVNRATWIAMKLPASQWKSLDTYRAKVRADLTATKKERIEIMISEAMKYQGAKSHYVWGGAGSPKQGADCSGLVLQALYAAGMNPKSITTVKHSLPAYRTSRELMSVGNMKKVKYSSKKRGDLVFFGYRGGPISHVGIYLGNGKFFDLREDGANTRSLGPIYARTLHTKSTVVRPFP